MYIRTTSSSTAIGSFPIQYNLSHFSSNPVFILGNTFTFATSLTTEMDLRVLYPSISNIDTPPRKFDSTSLQMDVSGCFISTDIEPGRMERPTYQTLPSRLRRGHTKSKRGCYNCKRRRIKCQEVRPACPNCSRQRLECEYPPRRQRLELAIQSANFDLGSMIQLQSTPNQLSLTDMRLFHHFIVTAYPHLPLGNDKVWVKDIASFAHSYDYLAHAVLGMAASHLNLTSTSSLTSEALTHRIQAIRGLNKALSDSPKRSCDVDALLATCYALALQASYIGESVEEFLIMLHGCQLIIAQGWPQKMGTVFNSLSEECQLQVASSRLNTLPIIDSKFVDAAKQSLGPLEPLCQTLLEKKVYRNLKDSVFAFDKSSREAYFKFSALCTSLSSMPHQDFQILVDPTNTTMQILLAHFVAMQVLTFPLKACDWNGRDVGKPNRTSIFRLENLYNNTPFKLRRYLDWPMRATGSALSICEDQPRKGLFAR